MGDIKIDNKPLVPPVEKPAEAQPGKNQDNPNNKNKNTDEQNAAAIGAMLERMNLPKR